MVNGETKLVKQVDSILREIEELKAIFILGQRVIPFLEELFHFVREVGPMLDEINKSLEESSNKIPRASNQLNTVTKTTEVATTEILDALDQMSLKFGEMKGFINVMRQSYEKQKKIAGGIGRYIERGEFDKVSKNWVKFYTAFKSLNGFDDILEKLSDVKRDADNIMVALQFQDITAQQISAINHLIESVQEKLNHLLGKLGNLDIKKDSSVSGRNVASFNPDAEYDRTGAKQKAVDEILNGIIERDEEAGDRASQEEIDELFNKSEKIKSGEGDVNSGNF